MQFGAAWPDANFELIDETTEIAPGIHLIALISDKPGTLELKELSLAIDTPEGVVVIVGCSHPGINRIVEAAAAINNRIHMVAGGLHLVVAQDADIAKLITQLHDIYGGWLPVIVLESRPSQLCSRPSVIVICMPGWAPPSGWEPTRAPVSTNPGGSPWMKRTLGTTAGQCAVT